MAGTTTADDTDGASDPARRPAPDARPPAHARDERGHLAFLAEASDLLAGALDEELVAALAAQLVVPRLGGWCAVYLADEASPAAPPRLSRVWHTDERRIAPLRGWLAARPPMPEASGPPPVLTEPLRAPHGRTVAAPAWIGSPWTYPLRCGERVHGFLLIGRGRPGASDRAFDPYADPLVEDFARRVATALDTARRYGRAQQANRQLQRGLLPVMSAALPGVETRVVYEPAGEGAEAGGDFYDLFDVGGGLSAFALGDVCGSGPAAAALSGLARYAVRMLGRDGRGPAGVMDRLNRVILDEAGQARFLSLLYGELSPRPDGGVDCVLASAGHPPALHLTLDGTVREATEPQLLLGIDETQRYGAQLLRLAPGEALVAVTDGVTERRDGPRMLDDGGGLARILADCGGLTASGIADRIRRAVWAYAPAPPDDDVAILALRAKPGP